MSRIAVYTWGFCDQLTVVGPERTAAPASVRALSSALVESLRSFSVQSAQCSFDCDKVLLRNKVLDLYTSVSAFERFARVAGIIIVTWSLVMSPAVYSPERYALQVEPWSVLARDLGFAVLAQLLSDFDAVAVYALHSSGTPPPETVKGYVSDVQKLFFGPIAVIFEKEKKLALRTGNSEDTVEK